MKFGPQYFQNRDYIQKPNYADMPLPEVKRWEPSTVAEVFVDDTIQKSKTARGAKNKKGAGGKRVKFAYDLMSKEDKKNYTKERNSVSYNRNEVIGLNAFNMLERSRQKELLEHWFTSSIVSKSELAEKWGLSVYFLEKKMAELNVNISPDVWKKMRSEKTKQFRASLTLEQNKERIEKQKEGIARKKEEVAAARAEAARAAKEKEEKAVRAKIEEELRAQMKQELNELYEQASQQAKQLQEREQQIQAAKETELPQPAARKVMSMPVIEMPELPANESAEKFEMKFEINNRSGVMSLEMLGRMLAFMNGDNKTLYKISIHVEEI